MFAGISGNQPSPQGLYIFFAITIVNSGFKKRNLPQWKGGEPIGLRFLLNLSVIYADAAI